MKILYVTTFNKSFYELCTHNLINTFIQNVDGTLLACYEEDIPRMPAHEKIIYKNIDEDKFLLSWINDNLDIIPEQYGGSMKSKFVQGTVEMFNFRASKWFRKVVALNNALEIYDEYDALILIDADSRIKKELTSEKIMSIFKDSDIIYHLGMFRKKQPLEGGAGIESGVVGFRGEDGKELLGRLINKFRDGGFREYDRWDDGYVLRKVLEESEDLNSRDLVKNVAMPSTRVVEFGPFNDYVFHDKGKTTREIFNRGGV